MVGNMKCPECGHENAQTVGQCTNCGFDIVTDKARKSCIEKREGEPLECPICGNLTDRILWGGCERCGKVECPLCGRPIDPSAGSCRNCGKVRLCENAACGAPITYQDDTCPHCGQRQPGGLRYLSRGLGAALFILIVLTIWSFLMRMAGCRLPWHPD